LGRGKKKAITGELREGEKGSRKEGEVEISNGC